jgi:hypothetical protein
MRISCCGALVSLLCACCTDAPAQTYVIKFKTYPATGMTVTIRDTSKEGGSIKPLDQGDKPVNEIKPKTRELAYTQTILEREAGDAPAKKYKRSYEKATETEGGKTQKKSYQGRTLVFERKEGEIRAGVVGTPPLEDEDLDELIDKLNDRSSNPAEEDKALIPAKAVGVGERWAIDPKVIGSFLKDCDLDPKASRAEAKLLKVYTKNGSQFGVIEIDMKLAVRGMLKRIKFDPPALFEVNGTIDTAIDASSTARKETFAGTIKGKASVAQDGKTRAIEMVVQISGQQERSEEKDDPEARQAPAVKLVGPGGEWTEFTSKDNRFSATFPGKPEVKTTEDLPNERTTTNVMATRAKGAISYSVIYTDYARADPKADPKTVLKSVAAIHAKSTKSKKDIELNGIPGVELACKLDQGGAILDMAYRAFYLRGRLYQVMVISDPIVKEKVQATRFLDSFKLLDKKDEKEPKKDGK